MVMLLGDRCEGRGRDEYPRRRRRSRRESRQRPLTHLQTLRVELEVGMHAQNEAILDVCKHPDLIEKTKRRKKKETHLADSRRTRKDHLDALKASC